MTATCVYPWCICCRGRRGEKGFYRNMDSSVGDEGGVNRLEVGLWDIGMSKEATNHYDPLNQI